MASIQYRLAVTASGLRHVLVGIVVSLGAITAAPAPTAAAASKVVAQRVAGPVPCTAQATTARVEVRCPSTTVAELLSVLQQATGLRSEYPQELARARVSVTLRRPSIVAVLESALSAYNFAMWTDQSSPSVTWVKILEPRRTVEGAALAQAPQQPSKPPPEEAPASLPLLNNEAEMTEVQANFARSVTFMPEVEPIPVVTSPVIMPGVDTPR